VHSELCCVLGNCNCMLLLIVENLRKVSFVSRKSMKTKMNPKTFFFEIAEEVS
jgi:hypothetical protein